MTISGAQRVYKVSAAVEARRSYRAGSTGVTTGVAPGFVQGNLVVLPEKEAEAFHRFCLANPKPCPIVGMSEVGNPRIPALGEDLDIRTDLPGYRIWKKGELVEQPTDITSHWRDDLVAFVIGCSFSFEEALMQDGLRIRHIDQNSNVPMYRTSIQCEPAGGFAGRLVVSMRPFKAADAIRAIEITSRFPAVHGSPVHIGAPELIGIKDLLKPDYGDPVAVHPDETPVFWACGVTPQSVILDSKPEFAITHAPGSMLVTDLINSDFAVN